MKKIIFVLIFILSLSASAFASDVDVQINGEIVNFKDEQGNVVNAQIINDRTMVPMRKIFEILGVQIDWDGENKIVTAQKDNTMIKLQIDNTSATKVVNGEEEEIILDTPPTIVNDRTMVPLRFIAESLDKQVGWDNKNKTAIIIDYGYFSNKIKQDAPALYTFFNTKKDYIECNITNKYYDLANEINNTTFNIKINAKLEDNIQNATLTITGTSELSNEIVSEGWNSTQFSLKYDDEKILLNTNNLKLMEMFKIKNKGINKTYDELSLLGTPNASFDEMFKIWAGVTDDKLDVNTFLKLKNDFELLCNLFNTKNVSNSELNSTSSIIRYNTYNIEYFDLAKLDNFIFDNDHIKLCNLINKLFFKKDLQKDVILYDTSSIRINFSADNDIFRVNIETNNEYNEKNEYIIELKHV